MSKPLLEIACFSEESAIKAFLCGVDRIEICEDIFIGGKTPSDRVIDSIIQHTGDIKRMVMIHKLGSNYNYTKRDFMWMMDRIGDINEKEVHGFVFGAVTDKNELDTEKLNELITSAEGKECTFHRAFDSVVNKTEALEQLIELGFKRVLTAGGDGNAIHNLDTLAALNKQAAGRIIILPGGGIRSHNVAQLLEKTGVSEIHTSAVTKGDIADEAEISRIKSAIALANH
jgi:copper homeostasis protein